MSRRVNFCGIFDSSPEGIISTSCIASYKLNNPTDDISVAILSKDGKIDLKDPELGGWPFKSLENEINRQCEFKYHTVGFVPLGQMSVIPAEGVQSFICPTIYTNFPTDIKKAVGNNVKGFLGSYSNYSCDILKVNFPKASVKKIPLAHSKDGTSCQIINKDDPVEFWSTQIGATFPKETQIIGSIGQFQERKGHSRLIDAVTHIGESRPVLLVTAWFNPVINTGFPHFRMHELNYEPIPNKSGVYLYKRKNTYICLLPRINVRTRLHELFSKIHVYCAPSLAESFNLSLFEMMSIGTLCCATFNTGHLDYVNNSNCIKIECSDKLVSANDGFYYKGESSWHEVLIEDIVYSLNLTLKLNLEEKTRIINSAVKDTLLNTWENTGKILTNAIWKQS